MSEPQVSCQWVQAFAQLNQELRKDSDPGEILELMTQNAVKASGADLGLVFLGSQSTQGTQTPWMCEVAKGNPGLVDGYLGSTVDICLQQATKPHLGDASYLIPLNFTGNSPLLGSALFIPIYDLDDANTTNDDATGSFISNSTDHTDQNHHCELVNDAIASPVDDASNSGDSTNHSPNLSGMMVLAKRNCAPSFSEANLHGANIFVNVCGNVIGLLQNQVLPPMSAPSVPQSITQSAPHSDCASKLAKISRDLHDLVIQQLFATGMELDGLRRRIRTEGIPKTLLMHFLKATQSNLDEAIRQIRVIVDGMKESDDSASLIDGIITEASRARGALGFAPTLLFVLDDHILDPERSDWKDQSADMCARVCPEITKNVVAVVREALSNVARHAHARAASVRVTVNGTGPTGELILTIVDDGIGIDAQIDRRSGLSNMRRRASEHSGSFSISAGPRGHGISVVWRVPLLVLPAK